MAESVSRASSPERSVLKVSEIPNSASVAACDSKRSAAAPRPAAGLKRMQAEDLTRKQAREMETPGIAGRYTI
jgi:hypothetical protein